MAVNYPYQIKILLARLLPLYLYYFLCRLLFFLVNLHIFSSVSISHFLADSWYGLRFDSFSVCAGSSLFILLSALPVKQFYSAWYQVILKWTFLLPNALFILLNCIDFAYFPFIKKRSGADLFKQAGGQTDLGHLLPQYIRDFWWVLLLFIGFIILMVHFYKRVRVVPQNDGRTIMGRIILSLFGFIIVAGLTVLGIRGGLLRIPADIIDAGTHVPVNEVPIVLNTPFTILKTLDKDELKELHFYSDSDLEKIFDPIHHFDSLTFRKKNIVVLLLESFAKEYTSLGKTGRSYTPFLDSLMQSSLVFTNGFANGSKSIEGVPAVLSGMPHMMENPYINSSYAGNVQTSFATLLSAEGYETGFFHGGINGTMNFDAYSKLAGYRHYFGRNEYNDDTDFDGFWGIWDEPFLQYTTRKISEFKQPFHAAIFTLSSHHPYFVPEKYKGKFPKGHLENSASIGYADHALKLFFESARKTSWYDNTLFILCADHAALSEHPFYKNMVGQQCIPIVFFTPNHSLSGSFSGSFAQVDILPSAMNILGYNKSFFAFGNSYLKRNNNYCYYYTNGNEMMIADSLVASFNSEHMTALYNFRRDSVLEKNILGKFPVVETEMKRNLAGFLQSYNNSLIHNTTVVK